MITAAMRTRLREFTVDIDVRLDAETLVIVGPSGCGKTTTLRMLAGLLNPYEGRIVLDGRTLFDSQNQVALAPERRNVGVVFQNYALFPHLSVAANVGYGLARVPKDERADRVARALQRVQISGLAHARPDALSGGEQQRVAVARALVTEPRLLLLDEPLSALDVQTRASLRRELATLLSQLAIPTIVVTHDLADAEVLADRIAVMDRGRIVQTGLPDDVVAEPVNAFIAEFTGANVIPADLVHASAAAARCWQLTPLGLHSALNPLPACTHGRRRSPACSNVETSSGSGWIGRRTPWLTWRSQQRPGSGSAISSSRPSIPRTPATWWSPPAATRVSTRSAPRQRTLRVPGCIAAWPPPSP